MGDAHVKILFATFKDCSKKGTCVAWNKFNWFE